MTGEDEKSRYRVGDNPELDGKFAKYKKANLFAGEAYHDELSQEEAKTLIKLWGKARRLPYTLEVQDVSTLVEFHVRIIAWRKRRRREVARIRKDKARRKLRDGAKKGNRKAVLKLRSIKKADRAKSAKYRKMKKDLRDETKKKM